MLAKYAPGSKCGPSCFCNLNKIEKSSLSLYVDFLIVDTDHVGYCWFDVGFEVQYVLYQYFDTMYQNIDIKHVMYGDYLLLGFQCYYICSFSMFPISVVELVMQNVAIVKMDCSNI